MDLGIDLSFLRQEYQQLQQTVETFDEKALTIKAWSITFSLAGVAAAFVEEAPVLLLISGVASLLFWVTEAIWKQFQQAFYPRLKEIESMMAGEDVENPVTPRTSTAWSEAWKNRSKQFPLWRVMSWPQVFLPHAIVAVGSIAAWLAELRWPLFG